jgi:hypothetical protein
MATATQQPNLFELACDGTSITYSATSITGEPQLHYVGPDGDLSFSGDQIAVAETALGTEVTVLIEQVADLRTVTCTLLLPHFRLPEDDRSAFETLAIKTTSHDTIAGPPEGAAQTYEAVPLHGTASAVVF